MGLRDGRPCTCFMCRNQTPHFLPSAGCECPGCQVARELGKRALEAPPGTTCGTCSFYAETECQRRAPVANASPDRDFRRRIFPVMHPSESCGEYERRVCPT